MGTTRRSCPREAAQWVVDKQPAVIGYDFAQEEKGADYQHADEILTSGMTVHRTILPRVTCQIENLINLDQIGASAKIIALPAKWKTESGPGQGGGVAGLMRGIIARAGSR